MLTSTTSVTNWAVMEGGWEQRLMEELQRDLVACTLSLKAFPAFLHPSTSRGSFSNHPFCSASHLPPQLQRRSRRFRDFGGKMFKGIVYPMIKNQSLSSQSQLFQYSPGDLPPHSLFAKIQASRSPETFTLCLDLDFSLRGVCANA